MKPEVYHLIAKSLLIKRYKNSLISEDFNIILTDFIISRVVKINNYSIVFIRIIIYLGFFFFFFLKNSKAIKLPEK